MGSQKASRRSAGGSLSLMTGNKLKRQELFVRHKQTSEKQRREERFRQRKEEDRNPELRRERLQKNVPNSIDRKRIWDDIDDDSLGAVVDVAQLKRRRLEQDEADAVRQQEGDEDMGDVGEEGEPNDDLDSMLDSDEDDEEDADGILEKISHRRVQRDVSLAPSTTSTNLDLTPASLALKFPTLFTNDPPPTPKILITTTFNSTLHHEAEILCRLFPNSQYTPRSSHRHGHKYSLREISKFAANRGFTSVMVLREDLKKPAGLDIVHLPSGPTLHFSISNFVEGKKLPGHGNPTNHYPELLLNNFKTPLGLLTAKVFQTLFVPNPEIVGRTVVCVSNMRDYLFIRRYRYVFRDKRVTEKAAVDANGADIPGGVRVGLQILGPNIHMKLRKVYRGIGLAGSDGEDGVQWEWKAKMEKQRTRFNL